MKNKGFTLTEIIVVIFIIVLLSVITAPIYQTSKRQLALQRSVSKLAQDIRRAQEMAMSARDFGQLGDPKTISKGGYGIYFNIGSPEKYILFADCDKNYNYDESGTATSCIAAIPGNPYQEKFGSDIEFEKGVEIGNLSFSPLYITFTPPDPTTRVNGNTSFTEAVITLQAGNTFISVKVVPTGLIYVE